MDSDALKLRQARDALVAQKRVQSRQDIELHKLRQENSRLRKAVAVLHHRLRAQGEETADGRA